MHTLSFFFHFFLEKEWSKKIRLWRKAKRDARKAYRQAKHARSANNDIGNQDEKIAELTGQLAKKQERLRQLTAMRDLIMSELPPQ